MEIPELAQGWEMLEFCLAGMERLSEPPGILLTPKKGQI